jgi:hypothetical protein
MKQLLILATLVLGMSVAFGQNDSVTVYKYTDEMTDDSFWMTSIRCFAISETDQNKGLIIDLSISNNATSIKSIIVFAYKLGSCNENNTLIFKFVDGSKIKLRSWNKFSCKNSYFNVTSALADKLKNVEVEKIYYQNGRTYDSGTFPIDNPRYFIQVYRGLK